MPILIPNDQPFNVHVVYTNKGDDAPNVFTISNPTLATIDPHPEHPEDSTWAIGQPTADEGPFVINATDGTRSGGSEELHITPGEPPPPIVEFTV